MVGIGLVGYGYWGPNLARNFRTVADCTLVAICDQSTARLEAAARANPGSQTTSSYDALLGDPSIDAIAIATPLSTHYELARRALLAGKDVLVEKPMTKTVEEAESLILTARQTGRILAVDHTFLFTDAVRKIKELVDDGTLGKLLYIDSVRTNLGLFHPDHNVIFDLAPHEISIMLHLVDREPISVQAQGVCHTNNGIENLAYVHLEFDDGFIAHFHLNWLAPVKIRQMIIAGSRQMVVYDDIERSEKVKVYNKGIAIRPSDGVDAMYKAAINYRSGDMHAPHLENHEALAVEAAHFVDCVRTRKTPIVTGQDGLRIVRILEATQRSLRNQGQRVDIRSGTRRRQAA
ncbi:MAG: Gfo/Idh/MocA family oxidoreductase [Gemmataceae bacterium]